MGHLNHGKEHLGKTLPAQVDLQVGWAERVDGSSQEAEGVWVDVEKGGWGVERLEERIGLKGRLKGEVRLLRGVLAHTAQQTRLVGGGCGVAVVVSGVLMI